MADGRSLISGQPRHQNGTVPVDRVRAVISRADTDHVASVSKLRSSVDSGWVLARGAGRHLLTIESQVTFSIEAGRPSTDKTAPECSLAAVSI